MKNTLRLLAATALLAVAAPAYAQGGGGGGGGGGMQMSPEQRMARQKEQLFAGITLSAAQSAKADTVFMKMAAKQAEMRAAGGGGDRAAMMEQMTKMNTERNDALKALLTTDADKAKFDENVKNMPQGRGRGGF